LWELFGWESEEMEKVEVLLQEVLARALF